MDSQTEAAEGAGAEINLRQAEQVDGWDTVVMKHNKNKTIWNIPNGHLVQVIREVNRDTEIRTHDNYFVRVVAFVVFACLCCVFVLFVLL